MLAAGAVDKLQAFQGIASLDRDGKQSPFKGLSADTRLIAKQGRDLRRVRLANGSGRRDAFFAKVRMVIASRLGRCPDRQRAALGVYCRLLAPLSGLGFGSRLLLPPPLDFFGLGYAIRAVITPAGVSRYAEKGRYRDAATGLKGLPSGTVFP